MPSVASKPSISESIWLRVCSRSSWPPPRPAPRLRPMVSISSTKMMARPILRADWKRSRTRLAPTPTNISMKSEPVTDRKGTPASPATARAMRVLPVPGGTDEQDALGDAGADVAEALGVLQEVDHLGDLQLDAVVAGDVVEGRAGALGGVGLGLRAADRHDPAHLVLGPAAHPPEEADDQDDRQGEGEDAPEGIGRRGLVGDLDVVGPQGGEVLLGDAALQRARGGELGAVLELAGDLGVVVVEGDRGDLALAGLLDEVVIGDALALVTPQQGGEQERGEDDPDQDPEGPPGPLGGRAGLAVGVVAARRGRRRGRRGLRHPFIVEADIPDSWVASN